MGSRDKLHRLCKCTHADQSVRYWRSKEVGIPMNDEQMKKHQCAFTHSKRAKTQFHKVGMGMHQCAYGHQNSKWRGGSRSTIQRPNNPGRKCRVHGTVGKVEIHYAWQQRFLHFQGTYCATPVSRHKSEHVRPRTTLLMQWVGSERTGICWYPPVSTQSFPLRVR